MAKSSLFKTSAVLAIFLFIGVHLYYPHDPSTIIGQAALTSPSESLDLSSMFSFSFAMFAEYLIMVFVIYLFLRSILKTFEKNMSHRF